MLVPQSNNTYIGNASKTISNDLSTVCEIVEQTNNLNQTYIQNHNETSESTPNCQNESLKNNSYL